MMKKNVAAIRRAGRAAGLIRASMSSVCIRISFSSFQSQTSQKTLRFLAGCAFHSGGNSRFVPIDTRSVRLNSAFLHDAIALAEHDDAGLPVLNLISGDVGEAHEGEDVTSFSLGRQPRG